MALQPVLWFGVCASSQVCPPGDVMTQPVSLAEWLIAPETRSLDIDALFSALIDHLNLRGLQLLRASTSVRTAHPEVWVKNYTWRRGEGVRCRFRDHTVQQSVDYFESPIAVLHAGSAEVRCRLQGASDIPYEVCRTLAAEGATDYLCLALPGESVTFASFATDSDEGFSDAQLDLLRSLVPALSLRVELASTQSARGGLLQVYLGTDAARRVLAGTTRRGEGTSLHAAIWACDLRGFTALSARLSPDELIVTLDRYFDCTAGAVIEHGGEVLKFIGDAVLAVFPLDDGDAIGCQRALDAAIDALGRMDKWNAERDADAPRMACGVGLHLGDVFYGNIGAGARLDFTVIGPAVNEAARIEAMCKALDASCLASERFVAALDDRANFQSTGKHHLKGVAESMEIFAWPTPPSA